MEQDYNKLFKRLKDNCVADNSCNAFSHITYDELVELNNYLDEFTIFVENMDEEELLDCEYGSEMLSFYELAKKLFDKDLDDRDQQKH